MKMMPQRPPPSISPPEQFHQARRLNVLTDAAAGAAYGRVGTAGKTAAIETAITKTNFAYPGVPTPTFHNKIVEEPGEEGSFQLFKYKSDIRDRTFDLSLWDTSRVTSMRSMFRGCTGPHGADAWNVSNVRDMSHMFEQCRDKKCKEGSWGGLQEWDTSKVTNMASMFRDAQHFDANISRWNVKNVKDMSHMFDEANSFASYLPWCFHKHVIRSYHFLNDAGDDADSWEGFEVNAFDPDTTYKYGTKQLELKDVWHIDAPLNTDHGNSDVNGVIPCRELNNDHLRWVIWHYFRSAPEREKIVASYGPIEEWDVSRVTDMQSLFSDIPAYSDNCEEHIKKENSWDGNIDDNRCTENFSETYGKHRFNEDISKWDVSSVTDMSHMFDGNIAFNRDLSAWNPKKLTKTRNMFHKAERYNNGENPLIWEETPKLTNTESMFESADRFNQLIWIDVSKVTNMKKMFFKAKRFNQKLNWCFHNDVDTEQMLMQSRALFGMCPERPSKTNFLLLTPGEKKVRVQHENDSQIDLYPELKETFNTARRRRLKERRLTKIDTKEKLMQSLATLAEGDSVNKWDISGVTDMSGLFCTTAYCQKKYAFVSPPITNIPPGISEWDVSHVTNMASMFEGVDYIEGAYTSQDYADKTASIPSLTNWITTNVVDTSRMFHKSPLFNQDISNWDFTSLKNMEMMFAGACIMGEQNNFDPMDEISASRNDLRDVKIAYELGNDDLPRCQRYQWEATKYKRPTTQASTFEFLDHDTLWAFRGDNAILGAYSDTNDNDHNNNNAVWAYMSFKNGFPSYIPYLEKMKYAFAGTPQTFAPDVFCTQQVPKGIGCSFGEDLICDAPYVIDISTDTELETIAKRDAILNEMAQSHTRDYYDWDRTASPNDKYATGDFYRMMFYEAQGIMDTYRYSSFNKGRINKTHKKKNLKKECDDDRDNGKPIRISRKRESTALTSLTDKMYDLISTVSACSNDVISACAAGKIKFRQGGLYGPIDEWDMGQTLDLFLTPFNFLSRLGHGPVYLGGQYGWFGVENLDYGWFGVEELETWLYDMYEKKSFDVSKWDVSQVHGMGHAFYGSQVEVIGLDSWDTSRVTNMGSMFHNATKFNRDLRSWSTDQVTNMESMFYGASAFNGDLSSWTTDQVTNMKQMFYGASAFNHDLSEWNTHQVTNMKQMFYGASAFNSVLNDWCLPQDTMTDIMWTVSNEYLMPIRSDDTRTYQINELVDRHYYRSVGNNADTSEMFEGAGANARLGKCCFFSNEGLKIAVRRWTPYDTALTNCGRLEDWDTSKVTNMTGLFSPSTFDSTDIKFIKQGWTSETFPLIYHTLKHMNGIKNWKVTHVADMSRMFKDVQEFNIDINNWDVSNVEVWDDILLYAHEDIRIPKFILDRQKILLEEQYQLLLES
jgi:surface protein